jgi:hypothetical protein
MPNNSRAKENKMRTLSLIFIPIVFILSGCTEDTPLFPDSDLVVVQAYLYAYEPVYDIRLTSTVSIDADTTEAPPVSDAAIILIKSGLRYALEPTTDKPGYYHYPGEDLEVALDDQFQLEIQYKDQLISAETVVPKAPEELSISDETLDIIDFFEFGKFDRSFMDSAAVEVSWNNEDGALFFIVLDNIEENPIEIVSNYPSFPNRFISQPINRNLFRVNFRMVTHYGRHRLKLYRINQEYADLYESRNQDSRDLNEPLTNIENGLGVFSAFNSDSVFFTVIQE